MADGPGKPAGIARLIGRRPIAAFGNSDGDWQMLRDVTEGKGRHFGVIIHHDDAAREYAYDREGHFGRLSRALDEAPARGWQVASMRGTGTGFSPPFEPQVRRPTMPTSQSRLPRRPA